MAKEKQTLITQYRRAIVGASMVGLALIVAVAFFLFRQPSGDAEARLTAPNGQVAGVLGGLGIVTDGSGLRLCNRTGSRVGVSIGYKENRDWTTEGWWNIAAGECGTLVSGALVSRFYYVYALDYDLGGVWGGKATMCTSDKEFTIRGIQNCVARGYESSGFFEVDTGEQKSWTVQLMEPDGPEVGIGG
ncbi:MAG: DUF1036 domain-containing protein [Alphaproteobacteria bacterium]